jgi:hypothetical protein
MTEAQTGIDGINRVHHGNRDGERRAITDSGYINPAIISVDIGEPDTRTSDATGH